MFELRMMFGRHLCFRSLACHVITLVLWFLASTSLYLYLTNILVCARDADTIRLQCSAFSSLILCF